MSEDLTGAVTGTIYGTFADAVTYIGSRYGKQYTVWLALTPDNQKRTLISAASFLDSQCWIEDVEDFEDRDALPEFQYASYEMAALIAQKPAIVANADASSNVQQVAAGTGTSVTFFKTDADSVTVLPPIVDRWVGEYLDDDEDVLIVAGGMGRAGSCINPFAASSDIDGDV